MLESLLQKKGEKKGHHEMNFDSWVDDSYLCATIGMMEKQLLEII
jgi:hypothetical protein